MTDTNRSDGKGDESGTESELLLFILIGAIPHIAINIIVPALPAIAAAYDVSVVSIGFSVTAFLIGFGLSLPLCGPLADSFGRRRVLLCGLSVFFASSLACAIAPTVEVLIILRAIAGMSAASSSVVARALLRDSFDGAKLVRATAYMNTGMASVPALGPLFGAFLYEAGGWRLTTVSIAAFGAVTFFVSAKLVWRANGASTQSSLAEIARSWRYVLSSRRFIVASLVNALQHGTWWVFLAGSPDLFLREFGLSPAQYGLIPPLVTGTYMIGSVVVARWALSISASDLLRGAFVLQAVSVVTLVSVTLLGHRTLLGIVLPELVISFCVGVITAVAMAESLQIFPERAGAAAGLNGSITMLMAALCTAGVGALELPAYRSVPILILICAALSMFMFFASAFQDVRLRRSQPS
jgi:DHA1 family bicyclomycin/chloramphenicol resistance-like MFS transporter